MLFRFDSFLWRICQSLKLTGHLGLCNTLLCLVEKGTQHPRGNNSTHDSKVHRLQRKKKEEKRKKFEKVNKEKKKFHYDSFYLQVDAADAGIHAGVSYHTRVPKGKNWCPRWRGCSPLSLMIVIAVIAVKLTCFVFCFFASDDLL